MVQNSLRPSMRQPDSVRVATVPGRVRSWPRSLIAAASTTRSRTIFSSDSAYAPARLEAPVATATWRRRSMLWTAARCMFTPIATEASPRAGRLAGTMRSGAGAPAREAARGHDGGVRGRAPAPAELDRDGRREVADGPERVDRLERVAA